jgi:O-antigen biosynthesis protein
MCYYHPAAYVWHRHRRDLESLRRQLFNYHKGLISYHLRTLVSDGDTRALWGILRDIPRWHVKRVYAIVRGRHPYPLSLVWNEVKGNLVGPYGFYKSVRLHRRLNGPRTNPITPAIAARRLSSGSAGTPSWSTVPNRERGSQLLRGLD